MTNLSTITGIRTSLCRTAAWFTKQYEEMPVASSPAQRDAAHVAITASTYTAILAAVLREVEERMTPEDAGDVHALVVSWIEDNPPADENADVWPAETPPCTCVAPIEPGATVHTHAADCAVRAAS